MGLRSKFVLATAVAVTWAGAASAQEFAADVPENVLTPDLVETETLGRLEFFDGMPSPDTVEKVFLQSGLDEGNQRVS